MKIFVCNKSQDYINTKKILEEIKLYSKSSIIFSQEIKHSNKWRNKVTKKMDNADFVLFVLGKNTFKSKHLKWELNKAKKLNKIIIGISLDNYSNKTISYFSDNYIFDSIEDCSNYLENKYKEKNSMLLEQYKMMVTSTEKVTDQRSKIHNLFFAITSSLLSISFLFGKLLDFSKFAVGGMLFFTILAFLTTFFWKKLIKSYGDLNKGKFLIINKIEKQLNINMFQDEWKILTKKIKYKPNSHTESNIVMTFRFFIIGVAILETFYFINLFFNFVSFPNF